MDFKNLKLVANSDEDLRVISAHLQDSIVYTSGKDGVLLSGIPIGKININEGSVDVNLIIDPTQLSYVNVILNKGLEKNN